MSPFRLRPITPEDGDALAALLASSADGGRFAFSSRFQIAPWRALGAIHGAFDGVVAEADGVDGLAGAGLVRYGHAVFEVPVSRFWFRAGHEAAARRLWEVVRWEWRDRGSVFLLWNDPRSALGRLFAPPPWMPNSSASLAVAGPVPADPGKLLYPIL